MQPLQFESITVDEVDLPIIREKNIRLSVLRLDKLHPVISGNKWFKLKYYLEEARINGKNHIATFGGAYSNHIIATSAACKLGGFQSTAIIRGEEPIVLSHTLQQAVEFGMKLFFLSREDYAEKKVPRAIRNEQVYLLNEGGYGLAGVKGATEILNYCTKKKYSHFACAAGTTTMMAGLIKTSLQSQEIIGIPVLKNLNLENDLIPLLSADETGKCYELIHDYHFGGYAKHTTELIDFMNWFYRTTSIPSDFVYTGKLFYGMLDLIKKDFFSTGSNILVIHSGGLQGNFSLPKGTLIF